MIAMNQLELPAEVLWVSFGIAIVLALTLGTTIQFFFVRTLTRTLREVGESNRDISLNTLWWSVLINQLPILGSFWEIFVVTKLTTSIRKEFVARGWNTKIEGFGRTVGFLWAVGGLMYMPIPVAQTYFFFNGDVTTAILLSAIETPMAMALFVCFILFWIQVAQFGTRFRDSDRSGLNKENPGAKYLTKVDR